LKFHQISIIYKEGTACNFLPGRHVHSPTPVGGILYQRVAKRMGNYGILSITGAFWSLYGRGMEYNDITAEWLAEVPLLIDYSPKQ